MNSSRWQIRLGFVLLLIAAGFNSIHYLVFRDSDYIFKFVLAQLGFLPISVFLVTVVVNQLLGRREKQIMLKKLNMVIGSFFSQVGNTLLQRFAAGDRDNNQALEQLRIGPEWTAGDYARVRKLIGRTEFEIEQEKIDWNGLRTFLLAEKGFLLSLLGNPNLLEHDSFTDLLWAVFHLAEELGCRQTVVGLATIDYDHLTGDIQRAYSRLLVDWLAYMEHLQQDYPYLFSLAVRMNPLNSSVAPEIQ